MRTSLTKMLNDVCESNVQSINNVSICRRDLLPVNFVEMTRKGPTQVLNKTETITQQNV